MSQAEQLESNSDRVFGSLSHRCCSQRQLALSVKQLITQVYHIKEEMRQRTQTRTNTFRGKDTHRFICEVEPIINPRGLSIKRFLLTDKRYS